MLTVAGLDHTPSPSIMSLDMNFSLALPWPFSCMVSQKCKTTTIWFVCVTLEKFNLEIPLLVPRLKDSLSTSSPTGSVPCWPANWRALIAFGSPIPRSPQPASMSGSGSACPVLCQTDQQVTATMWGGNNNNNNSVHVH